MIVIHDESYCLVEIRNNNIYTWMRDKSQKVEMEFIILNSLWKFQLNL